MAAEGLLLPEEYKEVLYGEEEARVDYGRLYEVRFDILKRAFLRADTEEDADYADFCRENAFWLDDYSLYMAVKECFGGKELEEWDEDIRLRRPEALARYR